MFPLSQKLSGFDEDNLKEEWLMLYSDFTHEEKQDLTKMNFDNMSKKILKRPSISNPKYPNLKSILNAIRSLPNSNADSERAFSVLTDLKTKKKK